MFFIQQITQQLSEYPFLNIIFSILAQRRLTMTCCNRLKISVIVFHGLPYCARGVPAVAMQPLSRRFGLRHDGGKKC